MSGYVRLGSYQVRQDEFELYHIQYRPSWVRLISCWVKSNQLHMDQVRLDWNRPNLGWAKLVYVKIMLSQVGHKSSWIWLG